MNELEAKSGRNAANRRNEVETVQRVNNNPSDVQSSCWMCSRSSVCQTTYEEIQDIMYSSGTYHSTRFMIIIIKQRLSLLFGFSDSLRKQSLLLNRIYGIH